MWLEDEQWEQFHRLIGELKDLPDSELQDRLYAWQVRKLYDKAVLSLVSAHFTLTPESERDRSGELIDGRYLLLEKIAYGGMGIVYRARQETLNREVAIKFVHPCLLQDGAVSAEIDVRFKDEIKILATLGGTRGIVTVYDGGFYDDPATGKSPYCVMELLENAVPITTFMRVHEWSIEQRLSLFQWVCEAVDYAHSKGIVHRDLKPANILVDRNGSPFVIDFGLAQAWAPWVPKRDQMIASGTPQYMSPEHVSENNELEFKSDLYSLGLILFEILTDQLPYDLTGCSFEEIRNTILSGYVIPMGKVNPVLKDTDLERFVAKALEKKPENRCTVLGLKASIERYCLSVTPTFPISASDDKIRLSDIKREIIRLLDHSVAQRRLYWFSLLNSKSEIWMEAISLAIAEQDESILSIWCWEIESTTSDLHRFLSEIYKTKAQIYWIRKLIKAYIYCAQSLLKVPDITQVDFLPLVEMAAHINQLPAGMISEIMNRLTGQETFHNVGDIADASFVYIKKGEDGKDKIILARLRLERISGGAQGFFPAVCCHFIPRDRGYHIAERNACAWVRKSGLWDESADVRWKLVSHSGEPLLESISESSVSSAIVTGLSKILGVNQYYRHLDLEGIIILARTSCQGMLQPLKFASNNWSDVQLHETINNHAIHTLILPTGSPENIQINANVLELDSLQVISTDTMADALVYCDESNPGKRAVRNFEHSQNSKLRLVDRKVPIDLLYQKPDLILTKSKQANLDTECRDSAFLQNELGGRGFLHKHYSLHTLVNDICHAKRPFPYLITGPPGSGKSALIQYLTCLAADGFMKRDGRALLPVCVNLADWETWQDSHSLFSLPQFLLEQYSKANIITTLVQWESWLYCGDILLLLDGLDEVRQPAAFNDLLVNTLEMISSCPVVLACRDETLGYYHEFAIVFTLTKLNRLQQEAFIEQYPMRSGKAQSNKLSRQIRHVPQLQQLASNPLLLTIICYALDDLSTMPLPGNRCQVYARTIQKLLLRAGRVTVHWPSEPPDEHEQKYLLERFSLELLLAAPKSTQFTAKSFRAALHKSLRRSGYENPAPWANALRAKWIRGSGILLSLHDSHYSFLYTTLHEFLAASFLAESINESGWQKQLTLGSEVIQLNKWFESVCTMHDWQDIVVLCCAMLDDPQPLLDNLVNDADPERKDIRLALAGMCLAELTPSQREQYSDLIDLVSTKIFHQWWEQRQHTKKVAKHLTAALPAIVLLDNQIHGSSLLLYLAEQLGSNQSRHREASLSAIHALGEYAATPDFLNLLAKYLESSNSPIRRTVLRAVEILGPTAAEPELLEPLSNYLLSDNTRKSWMAMEMLKSIGKAAAQPYIISALANCIVHKDEYIREAALEAASTFDEHVTHSELLPLIVKCLDDQNDFIRQAALGVVMKIEQTLPDSDARALWIKALDASQMDKSWEAKEAFRVLEKLNYNNG